MGKCFSSDLNGFKCNIQGMRKNANTSHDIQQELGRKGRLNLEGIWYISDKLLVNIKKPVC